MCVKSNRIYVGLSSVSRFFRFSFYINWDKHLSSKCSSIVWFHKIIPIFQYKKNLREADLATHDAHFYLFIGIFLLNRHYLGEKISCVYCNMTESFKFSKKYTEK